MLFRDFVSLSLAASLDNAGSDTCSIPYLLPKNIVNQFLCFVSLSLAASLDDASGDTFLIHTISLPTVSYTNFYVIPRFCSTIASSIIG